MRFFVSLMSGESVAVRRREGTEGRRNEATSNDYMVEQLRGMGVPPGIIRCAHPRPLPLRATRRFWQTYRALPVEVQRLADLNFALLKADPRHPTLHFKNAGRFWSVRVGLHYRALAVEEGEDIVWFWIGHHA